MVHFVLFHKEQSFHLSVTENLAHECVFRGLTAGRAKNEIPRMAQQEAMIFPFHDLGTASP